MLFMVLAGNHAQFREWAQAFSCRQKARYHITNAEVEFGRDRAKFINYLDQARGLRFSGVILIGTYQDNPVFQNLGLVAPTLMTGIEELFGANGDEPIDNPFLTEPLRSEIESAWQRLQFNKQKPDGNTIPSQPNGTSTPI